MTFGINTNLSSNSYNHCNASFITMTENRKRSREDDTCEFMPLSKRINNLHINNNLNNSALSPSSESSQSNGPSENGIAGPSLLEPSRRPSYDPGVGSSDSNYFFNNKLLFELHLERLHRTGQPYQY